MNLRTLYLLVMTLPLSNVASGIPNCYVYKADEKCYEACEEAWEAVKYPQGSRASQELFLSSIQLCPEFAYSYFEHAVPYAKRGQMNIWIDLIDRAVEIEPKTYLGWRGWYHWFFMHNYEKAISDIDKLDSLLDYDLGETGDGLYHLNIMRGLCYKGLGDNIKAMNLIENCISSEDYYPGLYDKIHLGVLYLDVNEPKKAIEEFNKQIEFNDVSEAYFYTAKAYMQLEDSAKALDYFKTALEKYDQGIAMHNPYRQLVDEIYRLDIEDEISQLHGL